VPGVPVTIIFGLVRMMRYGLEFAETVFLGKIFGILPIVIEVEEKAVFIRGVYLLSCQLQSIEFHHLERMRSIVWRLGKPCE